MVVKRPGLAVLSLAVRNGRQAELTAYVLEHHGLRLPAGPSRVAGAERSAIGIGPGRWLIIGETADPDALRRAMAIEFDGLAAVADLSDAFAVLRLSGTRARDVLAKGLPIDVHERCFGPGDAASSPVALIAIHLWQIDDVPTYEIAVPRSLAGSFAEWLTESAAEFGLIVAP
jgi:sarcosine oxidase subunit gamma